MTLVVKLSFYRMRKLRKTKWYSQTRLAHETGVSLSYISDIERGKANPSLEAMQKFAIALGVSVTELYDCEAVQQ